VAITKAPSAFSVEARVRARYQLTLPQVVADALAAALDDLLVFEADPADPGVVGVRKACATWAGALAGVFGSEDEFAAFVRAERASWATDG